MADLNARDLKLVQYLNEAYGKEKQLETALTADISLTTDKTYRKRLQDHLKETRNHARLLKSRIRALGGKAEEVSIPGPEAVSEVASGALNLANRAVAAAKGPAHALRGTGEQEKLLKNAKTQYWNEFEEIATYSAIETFAEVVGDRETQRLAKQIRREEERMAKFLERLIPRLAKSTAREEVPAALRNGGGRRRSSSSRSRSGGASGGGSRSNGSRSGGSRSSASSSRSAGTRAKSTAKSAAKSTRSTAKSAARTARSTAKTARTSAKAASTSAKRSRAGAKGGSARRSTAKSSGSSNGRGSSSSRTRAKSGAR